MHTLNFAVEQAEQIRDALGSATGNVELAMEAELRARTARRTLEEMYEGAESEAISIAYVDGTINGSNKEKRDAQEDAFKVALRNGELRDLWRSRNDAIDAHESAKVALEQSTTRFSGTKHAADLTAAILKAMTN